MKIETYSGKGNRSTQDDILINKEFAPGVSLHIVADGMGGYDNGDIAALLASSSLCQFIEQNLSSPNNEILIQQAVVFANDIIKTERKKTGKKLGVTFAGILFKEEKTYAFWLGDVRIYHLRNNQILFESEDHSLINELRKTRTLTPKELTRYNSIVTRSLTGEQLEKNAAIKELQPEVGDTLIVCSDGFHKTFPIPEPDASIGEAYASYENEINDNYSFIRIEL